MRVVVLVSAMLLALAPPAAALDDNTAALLAQLDRCAPQVGRPLPALPLGTLIALADGRSAREFAALVSQNGCVSHVGAYGDGDDEVALVSTTAAPSQPNGAVLWVDRGWWRISRAPTGYSTTLVAVQNAGAAREVFYGIGSGGSGGDSGVVGVRLDGGAATTVLDAPFLSSHVGGVLLDADHVLVSGRELPSRPYAWPSNCCLPSGHEWLFERRGPQFVLAAERQPLDPYFVLSAFIGGASVRDPSFMRDVGTDASIQQALDGPPMDLLRVGRVSPPTALFDPSRIELLTWDAIPLPARAVPPTAPLYAASNILDAGYHPSIDVVFRLDRDDSGWRVTAVYFADRIVRPPHGPS